MRAEKRRADLRQSAMSRKVIDVVKSSRVRGRSAISPGPNSSFPPCLHYTMDAEKHDLLQIFSRFFQKTVVKETKEAGKQAMPPSC